MQRLITKEEFFKAITSCNMDAVLQYLAQIDAANAIEVQQFVFSNNGAEENPIGPLIAAAVSGHTNIAKAIFNFISSSKFVINKRISLDFDVDDHLRGPLTYAAAAGNEEIVKLLAESGLFELSAKDYEGKTAAMHAVQVGHTRIADYLTQKQQAVEVRRQNSFANWSRLMSTSYGDKADQVARARMRAEGEPELKRHSTRKKF